MTKRHCIMCGSHDLVSYWHKNEPKDDGSSLASANALLRHYYADAERCVDCDHVMPHGGRRVMSVADRAVAAQWIHDLLSDPAPSGAGRGEA